MKKIIQSKRADEIRLFKKIFRVYCKLNHGTKSGYCDECNEVLEYVIMRMHKCPFIENKTFCSTCKIPCFKPEMREKVREVMQFTCKKMIWYHPIETCRYFSAMNVKRVDRKEKRRE